MVVPETVVQQPLNFDDIDTADYDTQSQTAFKVSEFKPILAEKDA